MVLNNSPDNMWAGLLRIDGTMLCINDNATSLRLRGPDMNGDMVQSYAGVFYNDQYDSPGLGIKKTRVIYGSNEYMDIEIQGSHAVLLSATDDVYGDGFLKLAANAQVDIHPYASGDTIGVKRLTISRVSEANFGAANTSDVTIETNSGDLVLWPGNRGDEAGARVTVKTLLSLEVLSGDPASPVDGDIWRTSAGLRGKIGSDVGTFDFTAD